MDAEIIKQLSIAIEKNQPVALVTVINKQGSGPRDSGSMMLVDQWGELLTGTIGGGGVEEQAKRDAVQMIKENSSQMRHYELTLSDSNHSLNMACGGVVDVFVKVFKNETRIVIFGGGHIALSLYKFALELGYAVIVCDEREAYCNRERFPAATALYTEPSHLISEQLAIDGQTYIVIVTHGHVHDMAALRSVLASDAAYVGVIGSSNKLRHCYNELIREGITPEALEKVHGPIGLDIGGETPGEIALQILAEIQALRFGKPGPFLKDIKKIVPSEKHKTIAGDLL